jgi:hypothetical protein
LRPSARPAPRTQMAATTAVAPPCALSPPPPCTGPLTSPPPKTTVASRHHRCCHRLHTKPSSLSSSPRTIGCASNLNWWPMEQATLACGRSWLRSSPTASSCWRRRLSAINSDAPLSADANCLLLMCFLLNLISGRHSTVRESFLCLPPAVEVCITRFTFDANVQRFDQLQRETGIKLFRIGKVFI